jgi:cytochrome c oxidase assembly protein subunit 15
MSSASQALPARARLAVSAETFRRIAIGAAALLILIVATGATVRLTASGLGCKHWPGCQAGDPFPKKGYHSYVEFSNRVVSFFTIAATLVAALASLRTAGLRPFAKRLAWLVFVGTLAQAPLGALTVYFHLDPYLVISHLLLSLTMIGLGVLLVLEATRLARGGEAEPLPAIARTGGAFLLAAAAALVVTGTLATAAGKYPGSSGDTRVTRLGAFVPSVAVHVRVVAAFGIVFLVLAGWAWRERRRFPWLIRACAGLLAILAVQMTIGEVQYRTYDRVPWWVVLLHVFVAGTLFAWTVGLVARLWRPVSPNRA